MFKIYKCEIIEEEKLASNNPWESEPDKKKEEYILPLKLKLNMANFSILFDDFQYFSSRTSKIIYLAFSKIDHI